MEEQQQELPTTTVTVNKGGSLRIIGPFTLQHADGRIEVKEKASFCRCGQTKNPPFCDSTHKTIGWEAEEAQS
ncbi:MAG: CDGSH iron-sulfur domain-containing protein [Candidatus Kapaibacterium sp.]